MHSRLILFIYCTIAIKVISSVVQPKYEGCYRETRDEVKLRGVARTNVNALTIKQCTSFCFNKGYKYAATRNGAECHCGDLPEKSNEPPSLPNPDDELLCNVPCSSDAKAKCGGKNAFSLYSTGIKEYEIEIRDLDRLQIGCLNDTDQTTTRILAEHKIDLYRTNSPKRCVAYCRALGFAHAGVQYRFECHCGVAERTSPIVNGCELPCSGDNTQDCGGYWRLMVYSTMSHSLKKEVSQEGCYKYDSELVVLRRTIPRMTPNKCVSYCFYQGLPFAHIYNGQECMCGKIRPHKKTRTPMTSCEKKCVGDLNKVCGGEHHMVTYETGAQSDPSLGKLESCHKDDNNNLLDGPKIKVGARNSIKFCISSCIQLGYAFAGLRNATQCQCAQRSPIRSEHTMAPDDLCDLPCPSAELEKCGGERFTALYRTGLPIPNGVEEEGKYLNSQSNLIITSGFDEIFQHPNQDRLNPIKPSLGTNNKQFLSNDKSNLLSKDQDQSRTVFDLFEYEDF